MAQRPTRSLKHEYELFVEQEIENYKESVPRSVLLSIGDDAVSSLSAAPQFALTEILLCDATCSTIGGTTGANVSVQLGCATNTDSPM